MDAAFWNEPIASLFAELRSRPEGLSASEAARRLLEHGPNDAAAARRAPAWLRLLTRFRNPLVAILLVASALSAATGDVASFVIVVVIVSFSVLLDFFQETQAQNTIDALRQQVALRATVVRDGKETQVPVSEIVPGDVVHLAAGDLVPADGRLLAAKDFFVNQALVTGEPLSGRETCNGDPATGRGSASGERRACRNLGDQRRCHLADLSDRPGDRPGQACG